MQLWESARKRLREARAMRVGWEVWVRMIPTRPGQPDLLQITGEGASLGEDSRISMTTGIGSNAATMEVVSVANTVYIRENRGQPWIAVPIERMPESAALDEAAMLDVDIENALLTRKGSGSARDGACDLYAYTLNPKGVARFMEENPLQTANGEARWETMGGELCLGRDGFMRRVSFNGLGLVERTAVALGTKTELWDFNSTSIEIRRPADAPAPAKAPTY